MEIPHIYIYIYPAYFPYIALCVFPHLFHQQKTSPYYHLPVLFYHLRITVQALISALQKGAKPRLVSCFDALPEERKAPLIATLGNYFELLCSAVVASRIV